MSQELTKNIIVFGETGAGKSSVVNMILGSDSARISGDATGCTFNSTLYSVESAGRLYNLYDTMGLGDFTNGRMDSFKAIENLHSLLTNLSKNGGIHLLVFVIRCGRLTQTAHKNYALFHQGLCNAQVPIVVVVTGCEDVEPYMEEWWPKNVQFFTRAGMLFRAHACVCAFKGRQTAYGYVNADLVEESTGLVNELIAQHCAPIGWKKEPKSWLQAISRFVNQFAQHPPSITWHAIADETYGGQENSLSDSMVLSDAGAAPRSCPSPLQGQNISESTTSLWNPPLPSNLISTITPENSSNSTPPPSPRMPGAFNSAKELHTSDSYFFNPLNARRITSKPIPLPPPIARNDWNSRNIIPDNTYPSLLWSNTGASSLPTARESFNSTAFSITERPSSFSVGYVGDLLDKNTGSLRQPNLTRPPIPAPIVSISNVELQTSNHNGLLRIDSSSPPAKTKGSFNLAMPTLTGVRKAWK